MPREHDQATKTKRHPSRYGPDDVAHEKRPAGRRRRRVPADAEEADRDRHDPRGWRSPLDRIWEGR